MSNPGLEGKVLLITGANHGIGAATARLLAALGAKVFIASYRPPPKYPAAVLEEARRSGIGGPLLYEAMQQEPPEPIAQDILSRGGQAAFRETDLTVNIVAPGPIQTGYIRPEEEADIAQKTPLGRVGKPEDVADVIAFLASEQAHWLTGQLLYVGGGWRMHQ